MEAGEEAVKSPKVVWERLQFEKTRTVAEKRLPDIARPAQRSHESKKIFLSAYFVYPFTFTFIDYLLRNYYYYVIIICCVFCNVYRWV